MASDLTIGSMNSLGQRWNGTQWLSTAAYRTWLGGSQATAPPPTVPTATASTTSTTTVKTILYSPNGGTITVDPSMVNSLLSQGWSLNPFTSPTKPYVAPVVAPGVVITNPNPSLPPPVSPYVTPLPSVAGIESVPVPVQPAPVYQPKPQPLPLPSKVYAPITNQAVQLATTAIMQAPSANLNTVLGDLVTTYGVIGTVNLLNATKITFKDANGKRISNNQLIDDIVNPPAPRDAQGRELVEVGKGEYMTKADYAALPSREKKIINSIGVTEYNRSIEVVGEAYEKSVQRQMTAIKAQQEVLSQLEPYKVTGTFIGPIPKQAEAALEQYAIKSKFIGPLPEGQERPLVTTGYQVSDYLMDNIDKRTGQVNPQAVSTLSIVGFSNASELASAAEKQYVYNNLGSPVGKDGSYTDLQILSRLEEGKVNTAQLTNADIALPKGITNKSDMGQIVEAQARAQMNESAGTTELIKALQPPKPVESADDKDGMLANISYTAWKDGGKAAWKLADKYGRDYGLSVDDVEDLKRYGTAERVAFGASGIMPASATTPEIMTAQNLRLLAGAGQAALAAPAVLGEAAGSRIKNPQTKWATEAMVSGGITLGALIAAGGLIALPLAAGIAENPPSAVLGAGKGMATMAKHAVTPWSVGGAQWGEDVAMTGYLVGQPAMSIKRGLEARSRPDVITADALSISVDVGRESIPEGMSQLTARQLAEDVMLNQVNGTVKASRLQSLHNVPGVDSVSVTRLPSGAVDVALKTADGDIVGHVSAMQRVMADTIYHADPNGVELLAQARSNGWNEAMSVAVQAKDSSTVALLNKLKSDGFIEDGYSKFLQRMSVRADPVLARVLAEIRNKSYLEVQDMGADAHHGFFSSSQAAQSFAFKDISSPDSAVVAIRTAGGEVKSPPFEVLDSPTLKIMRQKMETLAESGELEPGVYALYKGYPSGGSLKIEYELFSPPKTRFYATDPTWYAPAYDVTPRMKTTSLVEYRGEGAKVHSGQQIPLYWMATKSAKEAGLGVPSLRQVYLAKLLGDLTLLRVYAPWRLRLRSIEGARESVITSRNPLASSYKQLELRARPEDVSAGRVSGIIRNSKGEILVTRTLGQDRFDLPGGGVAERLSTTKLTRVKAKLTGKSTFETIEEAMAREVKEELGMSVGNLSHVDVFKSTFDRGGTPRKFQIFEVDASGKMRLGTEVADYAWWDGKSAAIKGKPVAEFAKEAVARNSSRDAFLSRRAAEETLDVLTERANRRASKGERFDEALLDEVGRADRAARSEIPYDVSYIRGLAGRLAGVAAMDSALTGTDGSVVALSGVEPDTSVLAVMSSREVGRFSATTETAEVSSSARSDTTEMLGEVNVEESLQERPSDRPEIALGRPETGGRPSVRPEPTVRPEPSQRSSDKSELSRPPEYPEVGRVPVRPSDRLELGDRTPVRPELDRTTVRLGLEPRTPYRPEPSRPTYRPELKETVDSALPVLPPSGGAGEKVIDVPPGSTAWKQGLFYAYVPPPYKEKPIFSLAPIHGFIERGSNRPKETLQIIGGRNLPQKIVITQGLGIQAAVITEGGKKIDFVKIKDLSGELSAIAKATKRSLATEQEGGRMEVEELPEMELSEGIGGMTEVTEEVPVRPVRYAVRQSGRNSRVNSGLGWTR